jgi:hypothetical protein
MTTWIRTGTRLTRGCALAALALSTLACDLDVVNPGPVQDSFLDESGAWPSLLQGVRRAHAYAYTRLALDNAIQSREAVPGGLFDTQFTQGILTSDNSDENWNLPSQARWLAEDGVRRLRETGEGSLPSDPVAAELLVHVGFTNRMMGHNHCIASIDGGPEEPYTVYLERAEQAFTEAIAVADAAGSPELADAARMGRADARMNLGDWSGAVSDAETVPPEAIFQLHYDDVDPINDGNEVFFRQASDPWREWTVWGTFAEEYYSETGDPRAAWRTNPDDPITMVENLPFYVSLRFPHREAPHTLASGWEMLLLRAEALLVDEPGNTEGALALINQVRTRHVSDETGEPLEPWTAGTLEEAWAALKQERRMELYLEGRRFSDLRRWARDGRPGATPMEDMTGRSTCFPVGITEVDTNPNDLERVMG